MVEDKEKKQKDIKATEQVAHTARNASPTPAVANPVQKEENEALSKKIRKKKDTTVSFNIMKKQIEDAPVHLDILKKGKESPVSGMILLDITEVERLIEFISNVKDHALSARKHYDKTHD